MIGAEPDLTRVPAKLRRMLRRCLEKDPRKRLRDIGDVWELLDTAEAPAAAKSKRPWIAAAAATLLAVAGWFIAWHATRPAEYPLIRLSVDLGPDAVMGLNTTVAISPDGRRIVYPARGPDGKQQLATRLLDEAQPAFLPGTQDGADAFFSPDGQWICFFSGSQFKKIAVQGGSPVLSGSVTAPVLGASWGAGDDLIVAMGAAFPLYRIPPDGGAPQRFTKLGAGDFSHRWPQVLPGGRAVLFSASPSPDSWDNGYLEVASLKDGTSKIVQRGAYYGRYLPGGYLAYVRQGTIFASKFDSGGLRVTGAPVPMLQDVAANPGTGGGQFDFSPGPWGHGIFVYMSGSSAAHASKINWLDSTGGMQPLITAPGQYATRGSRPTGAGWHSSKAEMSSSPIRNATHSRRLHSRAGRPFLFGRPTAGISLSVSEGMPAGLAGSVAMERETPGRCWKVPAPRLPGPLLPTGGWPSSKGIRGRDSRCGLRLWI